MVPNYFSEPMGLLIRYVFIPIKEKQMKNSIFTTAALTSVLAFSASADDGSASLERISPDTFSVMIDGDKNDDRQDVYEEALYKAAKKTLKYDYDWFRVIDRESDKETVTERTRSAVVGRYDRVPERRCGLLGCKTYYRSYYSGGFSTPSQERERTLYSVSLDFEMGVGPVEDTENVYDARVVKKKYK